MLSVSTEDRSYAAAFLDGEGSISIDGQPGGSHGCRLMIAVANIRPSVLDWLVARWGGSVYKRGVREGERPCWQWAIASRGAQRFLEDVFPYLKIKRWQAATALRFRQVVGTPGARIADADRAAQQELKRALMALNHA